MHECFHYCKRWTDFWLKTKTKRLKQWENFKFNTFLLLFFVVTFNISLYIWHQNCWSSQTFLGGPTETGVKGVQPAKHSSTKNSANFGHICNLHLCDAYDKCNNLYLTAITVWGLYCLQGKMFTDWARNISSFHLLVVPTVLSFSNYIMEYIYLFFTMKEASVKYKYTSKFQFFVSTFLKKKTPLLFLHNNTF